MLVVIVIPRMLASNVWPKEDESSAMPDTMGMVVRVSWAVVMSTISHSKSGRRGLQR
jgi:hypothetical protein